MKTKLTKMRPWLYVVGAFLLLATAWCSLIVIAMKHAPEKVELNAKG